MLETDLELEFGSPGNPIRLQYQPCEEFEVNGLKCAFRTAMTTLSTGRVGETKFVICRVGNNQIGLSQIVFGTTGPDRFRALDKLIETLKYKANEPTAK